MNTLTLSDSIKNYYRLLMASKTEKNVKQKNRYDAVLLYMEGYPRKQIAQILHIPHRTVNYHILNYEKGGIESLLLIKQPGAQKKLTDEQETELLDLYSRKIIAWTLGKTLETKWVLNAVEKAKEQRRVTQPLIIHSDRGVQYTCEDYEEAAREMERSYSAKGCPWDNACIESFHSLIKREWINRFRIIDYSHAYRLVFEYIEAFYNTVRIHSHCGYSSPNEYENEYLNRMELKMKGTG